MWNRLAKLSFKWRLAIKLSVFGLATAAILYPRPDLLWKQAGNLRDLDALIDAPLTSLPEINAAIDARLTPDATTLDELAAVERFVWDAIRYEYDWDNWSNVDYWPTAAEVWERKREDCDGQAVLAACILRSRGFDDASLVGNINHIWVRADRYYILGPDEAPTLVDDSGEFTLALPSLRNVLVGVAFVGEFPVVRTLLLYVVALALCYHPFRRIAGFGIAAGLGALGFLLLLSWAPHYLNGSIDNVTFSFVLGAELIIASFALALLMPRLVERIRQERHRAPEIDAPTAVQAASAAIASDPELAPKSVRSMPV